MGLKKFLWKIGLYPDSRMRCKVCGAGIIPRGYPKDFEQFYKCENGHEEW